MKYRMVAVDLDDSLLGDDLNISQANQEAIFEAIKEDVLVTIATGRMFQSALPYMEKLRLDIPVITYQGALIKNAMSGEVLIHRTIPLEYALLILRECKKTNTYLQVYCDDQYYMEEENEKSELYKRLSGLPGIPVGPLEEFLTREPTKMLIIDEPENIQRLKKRFDRILGGKLQITVSKPNYLEFTHVDATKGAAVAYLAELLSIKREEIIAIGDSYNDIPMIEYAGLGVAMGNAPEEVKKHADYVTLSNEEQGVAHVIDRFILGGRMGY